MKGSQSNFFTFSYALSEEVKQEAWVKDKVDEELAVVSRTLKNAALATTKNTHAESKKIVVKVYKNRFAKVSSRDKSEELAVESRTLEAPSSPPTRPSRKRLTIWLQGTTSRSLTWRSRKLQTTTHKTRTILIKNKPAESKKIAVEFTIIKQA